MSKDDHKYRVGLELHDQEIDNLAKLCATFRHQDYIREILTTVVKMGLEKTDLLDLKLINSALKELRYSFLKLSAYRSIRKVTVFGSARSKETSPEYQMAEAFSKEIVKHDYMVITGAGGGVMEAGNKGAGREKSFGVNINLPFEQSANPYIDNDHKLINFNYFFTRKLIFIKESCATVICPGGFGTLDEAFENITLFQTGKCAPRPIILLEAPDVYYWENWIEFVKESLLHYGFISESDFNIFQICHSVEDAVRIVTQFYRVYHSIRNVGPCTVLRLNRPVSEATLQKISDKYGHLFKDGHVEQGGPLEQEVANREYLDLPRLIFRLEHKDFGILKLLIDDINQDGL